MFRKHTRITWRNLTPRQMENIDRMGVMIFRMCDKVIHFLPDVIRTAELFVGGIGSNPKIPFFGSKTPKYQQRLNVKFIEDATGFKWKPRKNIFQNLSDD
jgi:hypothetical protein